MKTLQEIDMKTGRDSWNEKLVTESDFQNSETDEDEEEEEEEDG